MSKRQFRKIHHTREVHPVHKPTPVFLFLSLALITLTGSAVGQFVRQSYYPVGATAVWVVSSDFNHDTLPDLALITSSSQVRVLLNQGNGMFKTASSFKVASTAVSLAAGDLNGDGSPDLVAVVQLPGGPPGTVNLFLGNGDGTFSAGMTATVGAEPNDVVLADFNHDGKLDIAVSNFQHGGIEVFLGDGKGGLGIPTSYTGVVAPSSIAAADLNRDGNPDLLVASESGKLAVLLNLGDGTFRLAQGSAINKGALALTIGDLNHDGVVDAVVTASFDNCNCVQIALGNGDGTFGAGQTYDVSSLGIEALSPVIADFNLDGNLDVAVVGFGGSAGIFYGNGDGTLQSPVVPVQVRGQSFRSATVADFDGDGNPDLAVGNERNQVGVLLSGN
jgi:hypothetical protein